MDERALILRVSTQFASLWTEFETRVGELHKMNTFQQVRTKIMLVDNILWQLLQSTASTRARMYGGDNSMVQLEHVYSSLERTASRLATSRVTHPSTMSKVNLRPHKTPDTSRWSPPSRGPACECGGALLRTSTGFACTQCGAEQGEARGSVAGTTHHSHSVSPRRGSPLGIPVPVHNHPSAPRGSHPQLPASPRAPHDPVFDMSRARDSGPATVTVEACRSCQRSTRREAERERPPATPERQDHQHSQAPPRTPEAAQPYAESYSGPPVPGKRHAYLDRSHLKPVQENCEKFDFNKSRGVVGTKAEQEAQLGRYPSDSPRDRRPYGEGWSKMDGKWRQWRDIREEERLRSESPEGRVELVGVTVSRESNDAAPTSTVPAPPPPVSTVPTQAPPPPVPAPAPPTPPAPPRTATPVSSVNTQRTGPSGPAAAAHASRLTEENLHQLSSSGSRRSSTKRSRQSNHPASEIPHAQAAPKPSAAPPPPASAQPSQQTAAPQPSSAPSCQIEIKSLDGKSLNLTCPVQDTVLAIKRKIKDKWGLAADVDLMRIVHSARAWENDKTLVDMGLQGGGVLHVILPMN